MCVHFSFLTFFPTANIVFFLLNKDFFHYIFTFSCTKNKTQRTKNYPKWLFF